MLCYTLVEFAGRLRHIAITSCLTSVCYLHFLEGSKNWLHTGQVRIFFRMGFLKVFLDIVHCPLVLFNILRLWAVDIDLRFPRLGYFDGGRIIKFPYEMELVRRCWKRNS